MTPEQELQIIDSELERRKMAEPLRSFVPNYPQEKFLEAIADPKIRHVIFPAGNGVGKTYSVIAALSAIIWPEYAEHAVFNKRIFKNWNTTGYPRRCRIISNPKAVEDIGGIQTAIKSLFPFGRYKPDKGGKTYTSKIHTDNNWTIDIMSYEQDKKDFEDVTLGLVIFNEPPPEHIYNACAARLRYGGKMLFPMTPLMDSAWIKDKLVDRTVETKTAVIYGDIEEACIEHGVNGFLPHEAIQAMLQTYDPDELEARKSGKFMHLAGVIYKSFRRDSHVIDDMSVPEGARVYQVVDPAIGKPMAVIWAYVDHTGVITIYDEHPNFDFENAKDSNLTVKDYVNIFKDKEFNITVNERILDRHFGNARRTLGGLTLKQEFAKQGIRFYDSYKIADVESEVETGIQKVKAYLQYDSLKPIDSVNFPALRIMKKCKNTILAMERWARNEKTSKPKEEYKDFSDCVRYLVMARPEIRRKSTYKVQTGFYGVTT